MLEGGLIVVGVGLRSFVCWVRICGFDFVGCSISFGVLVFFECWGECG